MERGYKKTKIKNKKLCNQKIDRINNSNSCDDQPLRTDNSNNDFNRMTDITIAEVRQLARNRHLTEDDAVKLIKTIKCYTEIIYNIVSIQK